jgi:hypothetical protein
MLDDLLFEGEWDLDGDLLGEGRRLTAVLIQAIAGVPQGPVDEPRRTAAQTCGTPTARFRRIVLVVLFKIMML